jgi:hypothetical protein
MEKNVKVNNVTAKNVKVKKERVKNVKVNNVTAKNVKVKKGNGKKCKGK